MRTLSWWDDVHRKQKDHFERHLYDWGRGAWQTHDPRRLQFRCSKYPLTPELVEEFLNNHAIVTVSPTTPPNWGYIAPSFKLEDWGRFEITISAANDAETVVTLLHECGHGIYRTYSPMGISGKDRADSEEVERILNEQAYSFLQQFPDFSRDLVSRAISPR